MSSRMTQDLRGLFVRDSGFGGIGSRTSYVRGNNQNLSEQKWRQQDIFFIYSFVEKEHSGKRTKHTPTINIIHSLIHSHL